MAKSRTTWKKGRSGNRKGAPKKGERTADVLRKEVFKTVKLKNGKKVVIFYEMAKKVISRVLTDGDVATWNSITNRMDGMPDQPVEHKGDLEVINRYTLGEFSVPIPSNETKEYE